jgi:hypothetical protein
MSVASLLIALSCVIVAVSAISGEIVMTHTSPASCSSSTSCDFLCSIHYNTVQTSDATNYNINLLSYNIVHGCSTSCPSISCTISKTTLTGTCGAATVDCSANNECVFSSGGCDYHYVAKYAGMADLTPVSSSSVATYSRQSVSPSVCVDTSSCAYICSQSYTASEYKSSTSPSSSGFLSLISGSSSGCFCDSLNCVVTDGSGSCFDSGSTGSLTQWGTSEVDVAFDVSGLTCTGVYDKSSDNGLSDAVSLATGALIGIIVGAIVFFILIVVLIVVCICRCRRRP